MSLAIRSPFFMGFSSCGRGQVGMRISKYFVILTTNPYIDELFLIKK
jgi:hypothetical protein